MQDNKVREEVLSTLVKRFNRAWPRAVFQKEELLEWADPIGHLDLSTAEKVIKLCVETHRFRPGISEFLDVSRQVRRHAEATVADQAELPDHLRALQKKGLAVQRALLQRRASRSSSPSRGHDHRNGWESCEVCSGAEEELSSDACVTCSELEDLGIKAHHCG